MTAVVPSTCETAQRPTAERSGRSDENVTVIEARKGLRLVDWYELRAYRDLFLFLTWRNIKVQYAQSTLGIGWAIIQPLFSMLVFTIVFGNLAQVGSDGVPYPIFAFVALIPWTYFSNAVTQGANSLVANTRMLTKVYFPRIIIPLASVLAKLVDFAISMFILAALMIWYQVAPNFGLVVVPYLILLMMLTATGIGVWLTALAVQYRDIKYGLNFFVQLLMYAAPVVYPASLVPERYRLWYALNPMVGVIEGFRSAFLGTRPMPWLFILLGTMTATLIALTGCLYFHRKERLFADVA